MSAKQNHAEYRLSTQARSLNAIGGSLIAIGGILAVFSFQSDVHRAWHWVVITFMFLLSVGLGNLFLVALEYLVNAAWSTPIRRISEGLGALLYPLAVVAILIVVLGREQIFHHWLHPHDNIVKGKVGYLNIGFFTVRVLLCFGLWCLFHKLFTANSQAQDKDGDPKYTHRNVRLSTVFMLVFAISITVAAMDWIMSLDPHWFSTMFGVYYFAGTLIAAVSVLTLFTVYLKENGYLHPALQKDTYYSLGLMMFAFNTFWAYIAFSQFMLIWYANLPEETLWFIKRWDHGWMYVSLALMVLHFFVPFFALLSRTVKTVPGYLKFMAFYLLGVHFLDLYWLIMPNYHPEEHGSVFGLTDLGFVAVAAGIVIVVFHKAISRFNLTPIKDPKLERGIHFRM